uniref:Uncharacterized protein LOC104216551 isoform X2 n=1 Tax=Nicotiana sylvestris TaxID=4096 RepID=A0A1U7VEZ2_NICSY|nr:PREDICTED: uncharacterized protein LOC104216551 isoform X2 [Nicotiana sylvestris]
MKLFPTIAVLLFLMLLLSANGIYIVSFTHLPTRNRSKKGRSKAMPIQEQNLLRRLCQWSHLQPKVPRRGL